MFLLSSCAIATLVVLALYFSVALTPWSESSLIACAVTTLLVLGVLWTISVKRLPLMPELAFAPLSDDEEPPLSDPHAATARARATAANAARRRDEMDCT